MIDEASRIDCFLASSIYRSLDFRLQDGAEIVADGYVNVYEKGGRYSLNIRRISDSGQGGLSQDFEKLKKKLSEKGYFDEDRKKPLPSFPDSIAIITSESGAAVNDMLKIITSRNSVVNILIFPTLVQGDGAAVMIASRIRQVNAEYPDTDVIIVGRGGGSSEDLAAFSEEVIADAIFESDIPVISAVGHETDFSISDFVADKRAETPTAAAVLVCPDTYELYDDAEELFSRMKGGIARLTAHFDLRIRSNNMAALLGSLRSGVSERGVQLTGIRSKIKTEVLFKADRLTELEVFMTSVRSSVFTKLDRSEYRIEGDAEKLEALNPLNVLSRGFTIVEDSKGRSVSSAGTLSPGDDIGLRFSDGHAKANVTEVNKDNN